MDSSKPFRIITVGGGIAALSAAIALRAPGREITILEQSRLISEIGATISLQPNASRILRDEWQLGATLEIARGQIDEGFRIFDTEGKLATTIPFTTKMEYGADRMMYHRQDLHQCLKTSTVDLRRKGPPATIKSGEELQADLIVGTDGIHSAVRTSVLGETIQPKPTGLSAYRLVIPSSVLAEKASEFCRTISPQESFTSVDMAHQCRLIMGPARNGEIYSMVGLVPDEKMNEDPNSKQSWVSKGDLTKMLHTYAILSRLDQADFQTRRQYWSLAASRYRSSFNMDKRSSDFDRRCSACLLPTQGQGASQSVEDSEALGAFFDEVKGVPPQKEIETILQQVFRCRFERATTIQQYSREAAKPATNKETKKITMRPDEFMDYNCSYKGAKAWQEKHSLGINV